MLLMSVLMVTHSLVVEVFALTVLERAVETEERFAGWKNVPTLMVQLLPVLLLQLHLLPLLLLQPVLRLVIIALSTTAVIAVLAVEEDAPKLVIKHIWIPKLYVYVEMLQSKRY